MEEKKNNAVEKAEKVADNNVKKAKNKTSNKKPSAKKSVRAKSKKQNVKAEQKREKKLYEKQQRIAEREKIRAEKEKRLAEKRVELARIKAHKKAEKQKAKATAIREKNRRKAELDAKKAQLKAERKARKEMLKNESKKEKRERIASERSAKREARLNEKKIKQEKRRQAMADRQQRKEKKRQYKQKRRERNRGVGGWIAAVVSLGVATLVLSSVLTFTFLMPSASDNMLEMGYRKSFYDTVEQVDNIDLNLSKAIATSDQSALQKYLLDTAINSELAENDLQQLPLQDESKHYTTKLINQIGDYSKYLCNKISRGETLSGQDKQGLSQLYHANLNFKEALGKMMANMKSDYSFSSMLKGGDGNLVIHGFNQLQNLSVEYPELIYDGPFSDGINQRQIKGLKGEEIDENGAMETFKKAFVEFNVDKVECLGATDGEMSVFNVKGEKDGQMIYAQISKMGGKIVMFEYAGSCEEVKHDQADAIEAGEKFLSDLGFTDMQPVWVNLSNNVYTINFAYTVNDVIVYSDLVKVRVCAETNDVIGIEARTYYTNHTERTVESPVLSVSQAEKKVSSDIEILTSRLAIVPIGQSSEKLCYEFSGEFEGSTYYVYIDAITGRQVEMFKVIESTEGELLM